MHLHSNFWLDINKYNINKNVNYSKNKVKNIRVNIIHKKYCKKKNSQIYRVV